MTLPGIYRGVCVDPRDPQGLGRIRVQIPRVLGRAASGWAFPAWTGNDLTVWPEDRIPKAGQGVLVIFEDPDRMVWISMFGPQEFSVQPLDDVIDPGTGLPIAYQTRLEWELPLLPVGLPVSINGNLVSVSGPPRTPQPVTVQIHPPTTGPDDPPAKDSVDWSDIGSGPTEGEDLAWSVEYTRQAGEDDYWYRATWPGSENLFWPAATDPEQLLVPEADSTIAWSTVPDNLQWYKSATLSGTLESSGDPVEKESVRVYTRHYNGSWSPWTLIGSPETDATGAWSLAWTWTRPYQMQLQALYPGSARYDYSTTAVADNAAPSIPVNLAWTYFPEAPVLGTTHILTGTIGTADYGVPVEVRSLGLYVNNEKRADLTANSSGVWQVSHTFVDATGDYEVRFAGVIPWQAASTPTINKVLELQTTTSAPILPATIRYGQQLTATGTVSDEQSRPVASGETALMRKGLSDADWSEVARSTVSAGSYSIQTPPITDVGQAQWRADYLGVLGLAPSSSSEVTRTVKLDAPVAAQRSVTYSSVGIEWAAIPGASGYQVRKVQGGTTTYHTTTGLTYTATSVPQLTDVSLTVRAYYTHPQQGDLYSDWSNTRTGNTGRDEVRVQGSFERVEVPVAVASWRSPDAWSYSGNNNLAVQGYYSNSSYTAFGTITYNSGGFQQWVIANHGGQATVDYLANPGNQNSWTAMWLNYSRNTGSGSGSAIAPLLNVSPVIANQGGHGTQYLLGGTYLAGLTPGASANHSFPYPWWARHVLMNDWLNYPAGSLQTYSLSTYFNGSGNYAKFSGFTMTVYCNYNYVTVSRILPSWKA